MLSWLYAWKRAHMQSVDKTQQEHLGLVILKWLDGELSYQIVEKNE